MKNWYKTAQFEVDPQPGEFAEESPVETNQRQSRYRGVMYYEVRVPEQPDKKAELQAAEQAASELYQRVFEAVGDEVFSHQPPEFIGTSRA